MQTTSAKQELPIVDNQQGSKGYFWSSSGSYYACTQENLIWTVTLLGGYLSVFRGSYAITKKCGVRPIMLSDTLFVYWAVPSLLQPNLFERTLTTQRALILRAGMHGVAHLLPSWKHCQNLGF